MRMVRLYAMVSVITMLCVATADADIVFSAQSSGTFTTSGEPPEVTVQINHTVDSSSPFVFETMVASQISNVNTGELTDGEFTFTDADGFVMLGTYAGFGVPGDDPGVLNVFANFEVTGGTGPYADLNFSGESFGDVQFTSENAGISSLTWSAVPEPGLAAVSWVSLAAVLGHRRRRNA